MFKIYFEDINDLKKDFSFEEIYDKVSTYRKCKVDRIKFEKDKWLSLCAEYLLIQGLKDWKIDYLKTEIGFVENNKPVLKNCPLELFYNLSHSEEMAMCVISDSIVGCDIQKISNKERVQDIAERFFHKDEIQLIKNSNESKQKDMFYRIWVLKESYMKATGKGFQTPLKDFKISFEKDIPRLYINDELNNEYRFIEKDIGRSDYKSAICLKQ